MIEDLWWALGLLAGVLVTAALVNLVAPLQRPRLRRLVIVFVLYVIALGTWRIMLPYETGPWTDRVRVTASLLYSFGAISAGAVLLFGVLMPRAKLAPPTIFTDLVIGVGYLLTTLYVLSNHGLDAASAVTGGAVVSGILALSMQQTFANILGGIALQLDGSVHEGDWIQLENGKSGKVRAIRWRHTLVETRDWSTIVVPNSQLLGNNITILGWREGRKTVQRMWVYFNVDFRFAPSRVIQVVNDAVRSAPIENVSMEPLPNAVCMDFARDTRDSFAYYAMRYWIIDLAPDDPTNSRVRARIYAALQRAGIPLAVPAITNLVEIHDRARADDHRARSQKRHLVAVRSVKLLQSLTDDELETLAAGLIKVTYSTGETITRQGAIAHWLYILTVGECDIRMKIDPDGDGPLPEVTKLVATIHAPDFFGEMGLMTGEPRSADVIAKTECECFRLGRETFEQILLKRPEIAEELSEKLASRRVELLAVRDNLDADAIASRRASERERILGGIKSFFGLSSPS